MSIFNFLLKKSKLVSNKSLVPVLTKNIVEVILENYDDLELIISFDEDPPEYDDPSLMYSVDKYSCYSDSSGIIYGWIIVQRGEFDIRVNLIKYFPKDNNYISLFDFDFTGGIERIQVRSATLTSRKKEAEDV